MKKIFLLLITFNIFIVVNAQTYIYWTDADDNAIERANIATGEVETVVSSQNTPRGITIDYEHGKLFFADGEHDAITVSNLDGSDVNYLNNVYEPIDVCLDKRTGYLYYSDVSRGTISRMKTNGSYDETIISNQIKPSFLDIDILNDQIYFCSKQDNISVIYRADLDGANITEIIKESGYIVGVAVDPYYGKLYWLNRETAMVHSSDLGGNNKNFIANASPVCIGLEIDNINGKLYWSEKDNSRIQVVNTDGTGFSTFLNFLNKPAGIAIDIKNYCNKVVEVFDTTFIKVTDTLLIDVTFTGTNNVLYYNKVKVFPNPAKDYVMIDFGEYFNKISNYSLTIISSSGKEIYNNKFNKKIDKINVDTFGKPGLYFIQIKDSADNLIEIKKLILE